MYELRSVKTPREVIEAHQSAVTCIAPQHSTKVRKPIDIISLMHASVNKSWRPCQLKSLSLFVFCVILSLQLGEVQLRVQLHAQRTNHLHQVSNHRKITTESHFSLFETSLPNLSTKWLFI